MKSIDINMILTHEHMKSVSVYPQDMTLIELMKILKSNHIIVTDKKVEKSTFQYFIHFNKDELVLFEKKHEKKRRFIYQVDKQLFVINQRRAQKNEIKEIIHRLSLYNKFLNNQEQNYLSDIKNNDNNLDAHESIKLIMTYSRILKINVEKIHAVILSHYQQILLANYLKSLNKLIEPKKDEKNDKNKTIVIEYFKNIVKQFVKENDVIVISNITKNSQKKGAMLYTMYLKEEKVVLIEKTMSTKNEFIIDLQDQKIMLNNNEMKESALNWLLSKCNHISNDITSGVATVIQGSKK